MNKPNLHPGTIHAPLDFQALVRISIDHTPNQHEIITKRIEFDKHAIGFIEIYLN
jgi:hypothetical protein